MVPVCSRWNKSSHKTSPVVVKVCVETSLLSHALPQSVFDFCSPLGTGNTLRATRVLHFSWHVILFAHPRSKVIRSPLRLYWVLRLVFFAIWFVKLFEGSESCLVLASNRTNHPPERIGLFPECKFSFREKSEGFPKSKTSLSWSCWSVVRNDESVS